MVVSYHCIGQNQKNQPSLVLYLVRRSKIFVSVATLPSSVVPTAPRILIGNFPGVARGFLADSRSTVSRVPLLPYPPTKSSMSAEKCRCIFSMVFFTMREWGFALAGGAGSGSQNTEHNCSCTEIWNQRHRIRSGLSPPLLKSIWAKSTSPLSIPKTAEPARVKKIIILHFIIPPHSGMWCFTKLLCHHHCTTKSTYLGSGFIRGNGRPGKMNSHRPKQVIQPAFARVRLCNGFTLLSAFNRRTRLIQPYLAWLMPFSIPNSHNGPFIAQCDYQLIVLLLTIQ